MVLENLIIRLILKNNSHPGVTGFLNFALSIPVKKTRLFLDKDWYSYETKQAAVWAIPSKISTPGITGYSGKCPGKYGSLKETERFYFYAPINTPTPPSPPSTPAAPPQTPGATTVTTPNSGFTTTTANELKNTTWYYVVDSYPT